MVKIRWEKRFANCQRSIAIVEGLLSKYKGGGFYDKLGAEVGTKNPKKSAIYVATFIDRWGWFMVWRFITWTTRKISDCSPFSPHPLSIKLFYRYRGNATVWATQALQSQIFRVTLVKMGLNTKNQPYLSINVTRAPLGFSISRHLICHKFLPPEKFR